MPGQHKVPTVRVRLPDAVRRRLMERVERTGEKVNRIISDAVREKLDRETGQESTMATFDLTRTELIGFVRTANLTKTTPESERVADYLDEIEENPECLQQGPSWKVLRASIFKIGPDHYRAYMG